MNNLHLSGQNKWLRWYWNLFLRMLQREKHTSWEILCVKFVIEYWHLYSDTNFLTFADCGLVSHRVPLRSPLKEVIDTFFLRMIEHGLRGKQLEWSTRFFNAMAAKIEFETQAKSSTIAGYPDGKPLNISQLSGVFIMYGFGICTSFCAAWIEFFWKRSRYMPKK